MDIRVAKNEVMKKVAALSNIPKANPIPLKPGSTLSHSYSKNSLTSDQLKHKVNKGEINI